MAATQQRRINRYSKLLATLRTTEKLLLECEIADGGGTLQRTRQNIASVENQLAIWKM